MKMISVMLLLSYPEEQRKMAFNSPLILVLHFYDLSFKSRRVGKAGFSAVLLLAFHFVT